MKILAFDTSTTACSVVLMHDNHIEFRHQNAPMQQTKLILPIIQELLTESHLKLEEIDAIAYGCGPGSFTGIRIASSLAQGLGFAHNKPIIPVSSLAVLAQTAWLEKQSSKALIAVDARMEQIYWAAYQINSHQCMELIGQEQICHPNKIQLLDNDIWQGIGDGWAKYADVLSSALNFKPASIDTELLPSAKALLQLALRNFEQGLYVSASQALPVYLK